MEDFLIEADWKLVAFLMLFFLAMALFYTLFIKAIFKIEIKPPWLFFALFPTLLFTVAFINRKYIIITLLGLSVLLVLISVIGGIYNVSVNIIKDYKKRRKTEKPLSIISSILVHGLLSLMALVLFFLNPFIFFLLVVVYTIIQSLRSPNSKTVFLRLQTSLPTSKIRSIAMGLAEIRGVTQMIEPLISRLEKKECIGYKYTQERVTTDEDGDDHYVLIFSETICNPFFIKDDTGKILVTGEGITFEGFPINEQYTSNGKRYTQYLLLPDQEVLLIGKANNKNNRNFIERETIKDIFAIAPYTEVVRWNRLKPLRTAFYSYLIVLLALIVVILMTDFNIKDDVIFMHFNFFNKININQFFK